MESNLEKEELIEMMALHLRNQHIVTPLASKIWAILIIEDKEKDISFDYLLKKLQASKSSISVNLNFLLKTKRIMYSNIEGTRKKYFKARPFSNFLVKELKNLTFEKKLLDKIVLYRRKTLGEKDPFVENIQTFKSHLAEAKKLTNKILKDIKKIEEKTLNK